MTADPLAAPSPGGQGIRPALSAATSRLAAVSATPRLDAELLMAHALGISREALLMGGLEGPAPEAFAALVERRMRHEPVAYITGARDFWTITLNVGPGVLIPRPDSETLIEAAVEHFAGTAGPASILDLGTGSGALLLAALAQWPQARGIGLDVSDAALSFARENVRRLEMQERATVARGGWEGAGGPHDLILCNPPYIAVGEELPREVAAWEPASSLFAGEDGLDDYRRIAPGLRAQLAPGGLACIEIGYKQAGSAAALFAREGFSVSIRNDLGGRPRALVLT